MNDIEGIPELEKTFESPESKLKAEEILKKILKKAKKDAIKEFEKLGMSLDEAEVEANCIQVKVSNQSKDASNSPDFQDTCVERDIDDINEELTDVNQSESNISTSKSNPGSILNDNDFAVVGSTFEKNSSEDECETNIMNKKKEYGRCCNHEVKEPEDDITAEKRASDETLELESSLLLAPVASKYIKNSKICVNCPYTYAINKSGKRLLVWKASLVWMFDNRDGRISSDRLVRVQQSKQSKNNHALRQRNEITDLQELTKVFTGDYCLFLDDENESGYVVELVLHFAKRFGEHLGKGRSTWKSIAYAGSSVDLTDKGNTLGPTFGVFCQWYKINFDQNCLEYLPVITQGYTEVSNYIAHIPQPKIEMVQKEDSSDYIKPVLTEQTCKKIIDLLVEKGLL